MNRLFWGCIFSFCLFNCNIYSQTYENAILTSKNTYRIYKVKTDSSKRITYTYDSCGRLATCLNEDYVSNKNSWVIFSRKNNKYDNNGRLISILEEKWENETWINMQKYSYTYDNSGNKLSEIREDWNCKEQWLIASRLTWEYNTEGRTYIYIIENWSNGIMNSASRYTYTYDNSGNILTILFDNLNNGTWTNNFRKIYTYDDHENVLIYLQEFCSPNGVWGYADKISYTYDDRGETLSKLQEYRDNTGQWNNKDRYTDTYDNNKNRLTGLYEYWKNESWNKGYKSTFTYSFDNNMLTRLNENWENDKWVKDIEFRYTYKFDNAGKRILFLYESCKDSVWNNSYRETNSYNTEGGLLSHLIEYGKADNSWVNSFKVTYAYDENGNAIRGDAFYWSTDRWLHVNTDFHLLYDGDKYAVYECNFIEVQYIVTTGIKSSAINKYAFELKQNYPNPFNPSTVISYKLPEETHVTLTVYDMLGSEICVLVNKYQKPGSYNISFVASKLATGVYIARLTSGEFKKSIKMCLIK